MAAESVKPRLLDLLRRGRADEVAFVASLTDAEREKKGTLDHWSAKDHVAHLAFWRNILVERLKAAQRGETPNNYDNFLEVNDHIFEENRYQRWEQVLAASSSAFNDLVSKVAEMREEELTDPSRYPWLEGAPLSRNIRSDEYDHAENHLSHMYLERGDKERAFKMQRDLIDTIGRFDPSPRVRGTAIYNFGCFLALHGDRAEAIECVRESFALRPDLLGFSRQDPDLNSLRELPEFQALYPKESA